MQFQIRLYEVPKGHRSRPVTLPGWTVHARTIPKCEIAIRKRLSTDRRRIQALNHGPDNVVHVYLEQPTKG